MQQMKSMIKVSIITPCLNSGKTIRDTIESVLNQTYRNIEYIIVDGGSTDNTVEIIKEYCPKFHGRMKFISEKDTGIYNAMNKGIKLSIGHVIGIINSDDFYQPDAVQNIVQSMSDEKYQVIYGFLNIIDKKGKTRIAKESHESLFKAMIPHPTCFLTRAVYKDYGMYSEHFKLASDYDLMLRIYKHGKAEFINTHKVIANFRLGGASDSLRITFEVNFIRFRHGGISLKEFIAKNYVDYICSVKSENKRSREQ